MKNDINSLSDYESNEKEFDDAKKAFEEETASLAGKSIKELEKDSFDFWGFA